MTQRVRITAVCLAFLVGVTSAAANPPVKSPRPAANPGRSAEVEVVARMAVFPSVTDFAPAESLRPEKRPKFAAPTERVQKVGLFSKRVRKATKSKTGALCGDAAIVGNLIQPIKAKLKGCGLDDGVSVISVAGVTLTQPASMDCTTATALKNWVEKGVKPAFRRKDGGVAALQVAASYSCRSRNNQKGARISEHGKGRAIDISAVLLANGTVVTVENGWGSRRYGKALKSVRQSACGPFTTVLGPGSDRHHSDHFHLDTARRRGTYCR